ncbi:MAG TPA: FHA domain-containing protein [Thermoprotei archaeon]|nr:MAG: hypothetical protein DRJ63_02965 [Thermoprotei archaeon]HDI75337.1 FHA domain-containing protein [Thermoprotei archaeon]
MLRRGSVIRGARDVYKVLGLIKEGGMCCVYLAENSAGERVVVKTPAVKRDGYDDLRRERLLKEASILSRLDHPHIVTYIEHWRDGGEIYLVEEYAGDRSLKDLVEAKGPFSSSAVRDLFTKILDAFSYLHYRNIAHGDIKPKNILFKRGEPIVIDFNSAVDLATAPPTLKHVIVTPDWAAPEQIREKRVNWRTDVYQLGAVIFYTLTGKNPNTAPTASLPRSRLSQIALKALSPDPEQRYANASEMAKDLQRKAYIVYNGKEYSVETIATIGRASDNDIVVYDPNRYVHKYHCTIVAEPDGYYLLPGKYTIVGGKLVRIRPISYNYPHVLRHGGFKPVTTREKLSPKDTIALCYNPRRGPYKILYFTIK